MKNYNYHHFGREEKYMVEPYFFYNNNNLCNISLTYQICYDHPSVLPCNQYSSIIVNVKQNCNVNHKSQKIRRN